ncbi:MAG TPA: glycosyltransferase family 9 protein [Chloroflexota bacterium]|nr:glycosyltransferase family 9 protein [Chloroflexota bacterium]
MGAVAASEPGRRARWRRRLLRGLALPLRWGPRERLPADSRRPRVLVVRPDHLGDLLLATPALALLRAALPEAHLTALVGPWAQPVLDGRQEVDAVRLCPFPAFARRPPRHPLAPYLLLLREAWRLRRARYDAALVLRVDDWWSAALVAWAGIPLRIGYAVPESAPFLTDALPADYAQHSAWESWRVVGRLLARLGQPIPAGGPPPVTARPTPDGTTAATAWLAAQGLAAAEPLIAVHPGSGARLKCWPADRWAEVADALVDRLGARVVLTGSAAERPLVEAIRAGMRRPAWVAAGALDWQGLAGLFARCRLVLGVDSGPLHLAVALGVPTVHVFGPTAPARFGPWGSGARHQVVRVALPCSPCGHVVAPPCGAEATPACLQAVLPVMVLRAAEAALAHGGAAPVARGAP